jgi:tryptophan synthase alpha chain
MSRIEETFRGLKGRNEKAFIPFVVAGDPDLDWTLRIVRDLERAGADVIELGIPFSDPLADGPVIQAAALRSLAKGTRITDVFLLVEQLRREGVQVPLILFTYANPVMQMGIENFFARAKQVGADGVIVPDLPFEEAEEARAAAREQGIDLIPLVAPTSRQRIEKVVSEASGFVYCVSSLGVTGTRDALDSGLRNFISSVRASTSLPLAVGFGVSTADQAAEIRDFAEGVIVGSALVRRIAPVAQALADNNSAEAEAKYAELLQFAASLKEPLRV